MAVSGLQKRTVNHVPATVPADIIPLLSCQKLSAAEQSAIAKKNFAPVCGTDALQDEHAIYFAYGLGGIQ